MFWLLGLISFILMSNIWVLYSRDQISKYVLAAQFDFFYSNVKSMGIILEKEKQDEQPKHTPLFNLGPHFSEFSKASFNN